MAYLYKNQQIREYEANIVAEGVKTDRELMLAAGYAVFAELRHYWPDSKRVIICCGKGKNGGDGYVVARLAHEAGLNVFVYAIGDMGQLQGEALSAALAAKEAGVSIYQYDEHTVLRADVIIDALLGSGVKGLVREPFDSMIAAINATDCPVLAVDIPSGLEADTGQILGCAVQANLTVTFIGLKQGLYTNKASACCGKVVCHSLGMTQESYRSLQPSAKLLEWENIRHVLPRRARDAHKGDYGHVLVVGGDYGMGGAVRMAAEAALRVGAGKVTVATRPEHVSIVSGGRPELMCHQVARAADLDPLIAQATVLVVGPGLGKSDWAKELLNRLLEEEHLPKVFDADALNLLAEKMIHSDQWILTPHPGEASRLMDSTCQAIQDNRFVAAQDIQQRYGGVIVLKGAGTIIQGQADLPQVCPAGNPGMATGGMGDILSGVIGGLLAQKLSLALAAQAGVLVHALAADKAAIQGGGERGLLATDLLTHLREFVNP